MADETGKRDQNRVTVAMGVTDDSNKYITQLRVDPTTFRLKTDVVSSVTSASTNSYSRDTSAALEASSISKSTAGNLYQAFGVVDATAPTDIYYIQFLDSATLTGDGAVTHLITPIPVSHTQTTDSSFDTGHFDYGIPAANGIVIVISTTLVTKTISGSYLFATVLFK